MKEHQSPVCFSEYGLRDNIQTDNDQTVYDNRTLNHPKSPRSQTTTSAAIRLEQLDQQLAQITGVGCHFLLQCMEATSESEIAQSCLTPSDPMDCSLPGSSVHGSLQVRVLE